VTRKDWASWLRKAVRAKGMPIRHLAAEVPISEAGLHKLLSANRFPTLQTAEKLAVILDYPVLGSSILDMRTKTCEVCGATFVDKGTRNAGRLCSEQCIRIDNRRGKQGRKNVMRHNEAVVATRRLQVYSSAVVAFCKRCEPEGICRDARCDLRPASPLPYIPMSSATRRAG